MLVTPEQPWACSIRSRAGIRFRIAALEGLRPGHPLHPWFAQIVRAGTGREFTPDDNARWSDATRPVVEAFFHARYFLEMAVRYAGRFEAAPRVLPSGWAALLELYGLR